MNLLLFLNNVYKHFLTVKGPKMKVILYHVTSFPIDQGIKQEASNL